MISILGSTLSEVRLDIDLRAVPPGTEARSPDGHTYVECRVRFPSGAEGFCRLRIHTPRTGRIPRAELVAVNPFGERTVTETIEPWPLEEDPA